MYLAKLKLWNFRKYGSKNELIVENTLRTPDLEVNFTKGLNVLIGENDSGKTAIIDAIKIILKTHSFEWIRLEHEDFYNDTTRLRIECCSYELEPNEAKNFTEWLTIFDENGDFLDKPRLKIILDAHRNKERIFPFDICAGSDDEGYPLTADAKEYLQTTYLKPLRDTQSELVPKRNSRLSRILQGHIVFKEDKKDDKVHDLVSDFKEFQNKIESYFKEPAKGKDVKDTIDEFLLEFFGEKKDSKFTIPSKELKNILETLKITLGDENLGLGSNNLLFMATELLNLERREWDGIRLGLIEEIEAHLHPQAQLRVIETLQNNKNVQFILTTHSPNLASKVKLENLIICEKESGSVFPLGYKYTELKETDYKFLERFLDVTKANLFFAKGVILVEGWAEELLLSVLAKKIRINLTEKGVSIVNVGSTAFLRYAKIFMRNEEPYMKIPVSGFTTGQTNYIRMKGRETIGNELSGLDWWNTGSFWGYFKMTGQLERLYLKTNFDLFPERKESVTFEVNPIIPEVVLADFGEIEITASVNLSLSKNKANPSVVGTVEWMIEEGTGSLSSSIGTTDINGLATTTLTTSAVIGDFYVVSGRLTSLIVDGVTYDVDILLRTGPITIVKGIGLN
ncbi:MAG: AAA family ATPase, partial [Bacteroidetes bacterium]|nr:AAA family ATPase [Bacteroidota bacterium]